MIGAGIRSGRAALRVANAPSPAEIQLFEANFSSWISRRPSTSQQRRESMPDRPDAHPSQSTFSALFLRVWWMMLGNAALCLMLIHMTIQRERLPSWVDAAFLLAVASLLVARLADIRYFDSRTAEGARATMEHFRLYGVRLVGGSVASWGVANSLALL